MLKEEQVKEILSRLHSANVRFLIIGGVAMRLLGSDRETVDIDLLYWRDPENLRLLAEAMSPVRPTLRGAPPDLPFKLDERSLRHGLNFTLESTCGDIDLLADVGIKASFEELWSRSVEMTVYDVPVRVACLDDLIEMKRTAGRTKDQLQLLELETLKNLIEGQEGQK